MTSTSAVQPVFAGQYRVVTGAVHDGRQVKPHASMQLCTKT